jgi:hypothetical protein
VFFVFKGNCSNNGINIFSISFNWEIVYTNVSLLVLSLPQPKLAFICSKTSLSSWCKEILKTNSNPIIFPSLFLRNLIKNLDSF